MLESIAAVATTPADTAACPGSVRVAALSPTEIYSAWWSRRDAGRAVLLSARSDNGGATWTASVPVDTTDRGALSCARPAPSIAADSTSGYVHVTYFLNSPTGPGVFFSHSMERGELGRCVAHSLAAALVHAVVHPDPAALARAYENLAVALERHGVGDVEPLYQQSDQLLRAERPERHRSQHTLDYNRARRELDSEPRAHSRLRAAIAG